MPLQGVGGNSSAPSQPEAVNSSSSRDAPRAIGAPEPLLPTAAAEQICPIAAISLCHRTSPHFTKLIFTEVHLSASFPFLFKEKKKNPAETKHLASVRCVLLFPGDFAETLDKFAALPQPSQVLSISPSRFLAAPSPPAQVLVPKPLWLPAAQLQPLQQPRH